MENTSSIRCGKQDARYKESKHLYTFDKISYPCILDLCFGSFIKICFNTTNATIWILTTN